MEINGFPRIVFNHPIIGDQKNRDRDADRDNQRTEENRTVTNGRKHFALIGVLHIGNGASKTEVIRANRADTLTAIYPQSIEVSRYL